MSRLAAVSSRPEAVSRHERLHCRQSIGLALFATFSTRISKFQDEIALNGRAA